MTTAKTDITANVSGLVDQTQIDAADVRDPIEDLLDWIRGGMVSVSGADTHVKTLADALTVSGRVTITVSNPGGDEVAVIGFDDTGLVTVDGVEVLTNKELVAPIIASFLNAQHDHSGPAQGGQLDASTVFGTGTVPADYLPVLAVDQDGIVPAPDAYGANKALYGDGTWRNTAPQIGSVGLDMPTDLFDVTGSPVTGSAQVAAD